MTMLQVTQANEGKEAFGLTNGATVFVDTETNCFYFAKAPNGRNMKISKKTNRSCHWKNQNTSPVFAVIDFEPVADPDAWKKADDALFAKRK